MSILFFIFYELTSKNDYLSTANDDIFYMKTVNVNEGPQTWFVNKFISKSLQYPFSDFSLELYKICGWLNGYSLSRRRIKF